MMKPWMTILLAAAGLVAGGAEAKELTVFRADFSNSADWKINTMKSSSGKFTPMGDGVAELVYTVPSPDGVVILEKEFQIDSQPDTATVVLRGSGGNSCQIRLVDASGETHQYSVTLLRKPDEFQTFRIELGRKHSSWGGDKNGLIDLPVKRVALEVRSFGKYGKCEPSGTVQFKAFSISSREGAAKALEAAATAPFKVLVALPVAEAAKAKPAIIDRASSKTINGTVKDDRDLSARVTALYDDRYLYLRAEVRDDQVHTPFEGHGIYQNDGLEFWFDCRRDFGLHLDDPDDYQVVVTPGTPQGPPQLWTYRNGRDAHIRVDSAVTAKRTPDGYVIEAKLPIDAFLGMRNSGRAIGFNMSLCDNDGNGFKRLLWNGGDFQPVNFGLLTFGELPPEALAKLTEERSLRVASLRAAPAEPGRNDYRGEPRFLDIRPATAAKVSTFGKFELAIRLNAEYRNPFDPEEVTLSGEFTAPDGRKKRADAFWFLPHRLFLYSRTGETFTPLGEPDWRLRFTPDMPGKWSCRLHLRDRSGKSVTSEEIVFEADRAEAPGFLRVSPRDHSYLAFDNGDDFFGVGFASHFWSVNNLAIYMRDALNTLAAFGGNYTSVNFEVYGNGGFSLEHKGIGNYDLGNASRFDYVLEMAERRGVYIIPCLIQTPFGLASHWKNNPYNVERGGPCKRPEEIFTSPEVRKILQNRFRYILARWGYSPNILGWEIFNEVNYTEGAQKNPASVVEFHRDIARYLKATDPNRHLIGTSFGSSEQVEMPEVWRLPELDFTITHSYNNDIAGELQKRLRAKLAYGKPCIGGENGHPVPADNSYRDPKGIVLHNNLWAGMINKAAGNVLLWWGGRYHDVYDLHPRGYPPFVNFIKGIPFDRAGFEPRILSAQCSTGVTEGRSFLCEIKWNPELEHPYQLRPDGVWKTLSAMAVKDKALYIADVDRVIRADALPGLLGGPPLVIELRSEKAVKARLKLAAVGMAGAELSVTNNGRKITSQKISDRDGRNDPYAKELSEVVEIPLTAGENRISLAVTGGWLALESLTIPGFAGAGSAENLRVSVLQGPELVIGWLQNRMSTWYHDSLGEAPGRIEGASFELDRLANGLWRFEWHDTWKGGVLETGTLEVKNNKATIAVPGFDRDIALKLFK